MATKTGYAVGTVSRALNNHPNVSAKARETILEAARESGFQFNINAKQLKQQHSTTILVLVKGTRNELFGELVESIQNLISQTSYQLVVDYMDENLNEVRRGVQLCREKKPVGILFLGGNEDNFRQDFESIDIPCVLVTGDASELRFDKLSSVCIDDLEAARSAIDALTRLGHSRIAIIGGDRTTSDTSRLRFEGCMRAFGEHRICFDPRLDYEGGRYSYLAGYQATAALLDRKHPFTAIFAMADVMAIGAIRALWERGLRVPEDVSVMGVDGLTMGDYLVPQLATVSQDVGQIAARSVEILLGCIASGAGACHERVPYTVKCRESVCAVSK